MHRKEISGICCKVCGNDQITFLYQSQRYGFQVGQCPECRLIFVLNPIAEGQLKEIYDDGKSFEGFSELINNAKVRDRHKRVLCAIRKLMQDSPGSPRIFDIGAGSGEFLNQAREFGLEIDGNEISTEAIRTSKKRYGILLRHQSLEDDERTAFFDVVTMWGLIEHVMDPVSTLKEAFRLLRYGGILYIYTPVWCLYDVIGLGFAQFLGWTRLLDRRITLAHLQIFSAKAMRTVLAAIGLELFKMEVVCEYNLPVTAYLESLRVPMRARSGLAVMIDWLIDRGLFFRNNMSIFCRKPVP